MPNAAWRLRVKWVNCQTVQWNRFFNSRFSYNSKSQRICSWSNVQNASKPEKIRRICFFRLRSAKSIIIVWRKKYPCHSIMKDLYSFFSFLKMYNYLTIIIDVQYFFRVRFEKNWLTVQKKRNWKIEKILHTYYKS